MKKSTPTFWLTNTSNRNISLADLNLTVKAFSTVNLLDTKHYYYTLEQLQKSVESGSIKTKSANLVIRKLAPTLIKFNIPINTETFIPSRERSVLVIKEERYVELDIDDNEYASENAELAQIDAEKAVLTKE